MTVVGISMVKNEVDIIQTVVEHLLTQVDHIIISDNGSTDGTREILETLPITLLDDPDPAYYQSRKMTALAQVARNNQGADWIVPFDADEIWYSPFGTIKEVLEGFAPQWLVVEALIYDHVSSSLDNFDNPNPVHRINWRRLYPGSFNKVACRYRDDLVIQAGNHGAYYVGDATIKQGLLIIRHFPYRTPDQFVNKVRIGAAAYALTDLSEETGAHWRLYGRILHEKGDLVLKNEIYNTEFYLKNPYETSNVVYDPAPIVGTKIMDVSVDDH